jgi:hypothetical protein
MKEAASLHNLALPMLLPDITLSTNAEDFALISGCKCMKFKLFGELVSGSGS